MTMPQRATAPAMARPGVPGPRPIGRPMNAAAMARPVPAAHPAAMPVGRPSVPAPRASHDRLVCRTSHQVNHKRVVIHRNLWTGPV